MNIKNHFKKWHGANFCFYCNVDSDELKAFLIIVIGCLVGASVLVALGAYLKGHLQNVEDPKLKAKVLDLEGEQDG